jgi:hypothetical protein
VRKALVHWNCLGDEFGAQDVKSVEQLKTLLHRYSESEMADISSRSDVEGTVRRADREVAERLVADRERSWTGKSRTARTAETWATLRKHQLWRPLTNQLRVEETMGITDDFRRRAILPEVPFRGMKCENTEFRSLLTIPGSLKQQKQ